MWDLIFSTANFYAFIAWFVLAFLPRREWSMQVLLIGGAGLLSLAYAVIITGFLSGTLDAGAGNGAPGNFSSITGVQAFFSSPGGLTLGWIHYLAVDLFVGLWIAQDADIRGVSRIIQVPILFATLMAGPLGLTIWLIIRQFRSAQPHSEPESGLANASMRA